MTNPLNVTVLEMFNHLITRHPELMPAIEQLVRQSRGAQDNNSYLAWEEKQFAAPSPDLIKRQCLLRNGIADACWIETGTYLGETTDLLRQHSKRVISIEPEPTLFQNAQAKFAGITNVEIINGLSEEVFPQLLPTLTGDINFWLDGHTSLHNTFQGPLDTPIVEELNCISANLAHFGKVAILIDDIRLFKGEVVHYGPYPPLDFLVDWAREHRLAWHIEHDIFIAKNY